MKNYNWIIVVAVAFALTACGGLKIKYFTRINPDGTIFKRVTAIGDSSDIYADPFTFDLNDGWSVSYDTEIDTIKGDTLYVAIAEKTFESAVEAQKVFYRENDTTLQRENVNLTLQQRFRWFFTFNTYQETFEQRFPFKRVSIDDYLTDEQFAYIFRNDTSVVAGYTKKKLEDFEEELAVNLGKYHFTSCSYEYIELLETLAKENNYSFTEKAKQDVKRYILSKMDYEFEFLPVEKLALKVDSIIGEEWVSDAYRKHYFDRFSAIISDGFVLMFVGNEDEFIVEVDVPGIVYETNASGAEGNNVVWRFPGDIFQVKDYNLIVKYRTTNIWAFVLTGLIILVLIVWLFRRKK